MNSTNNDTASKYILVTGGSGLVGNELIQQLLQQGKKIKALVNKTPLPVRHVNLTPIECDLFDVAGLEDAMEHVDEVYHCAGLISYAPNDRERLYRINVEGTANIVNACLHAKVRKLVHVSSIAALGKFIEGKPIDESISWTEDARNSMYGHSKYLGEMEVWRGVAEGLQAVIVNPSIILGAGSKDSASTAIFWKVYGGFNWYSEGVNGFVDVADVARAMWLLMASDVHSQRFIVSAENCSYKDVLFQIADAFEKKRPSRKVNPAFSGWVCELERWRSFISGSKPLVTRESVATALAKVYFDNNKLKKHLPGFDYKPVSETILTTCSVLQQKLNK